MAEDSVPLPFPNLSIPTWHYQITSVPELKDQASTSFWKAVEEDGMSPSLFSRAVGAWAD
jgi:26S proteasome regulatory subunit N7